MIKKEAVKISQEKNTWLNVRDALTEQERERIVNNNVEIASKVAEKLRTLLAIIPRIHLIREVEIVFRSGGDSGFSWGERLYISPADGRLYLESSFTNYDKSGITKTEKRQVSVNEYPHIVEKLLIKPEEIVALQTRLEVAA